VQLADLDAIQSVRSYPCVSILLSTSPGTRLGTADGERLDALVAEALSRLARELEPARVIAMEQCLARLVESARRRPAGRGLALFANDEVEWVDTLVVPVRDRVVVDDTFATRDLVEHVHRNTPFWLLVLSERSARLQLGDASQLVAVDGGTFPLAATADERAEDFLRRVGSALDGELGPDAALVLGGVERTLATFNRVSGRQALGRVLGAVERLPLAELHARSWPVMARALDARQSLALGELDRARDRRRLATGLGEVWSLAHDGRVELVVVERGYEAPARLGASADEIHPADDRDEPGVVDDLVDDLVEVVLAQGGRAAFVDDGLLVASGRVAAVLRY
jgi:hypothetical protein